MLKISKIVLMAVFAAGFVTCLAIAKHVQAVPPSPIQLKELNPFPTSSPAYLEEEEFLKWQMANEKLGLAAATPSLQDRLNYAAPLVRKGLARLPDDLLEKYLPLMSRLLLSLSDAECGKFVRSELSAAELRSDTTRVVAAFSTGDAHTWFAVLKSAIEAGLDNDPVITITTQDANNSIRKLADTLPGIQGETFLLKLRRLQTANDSEACSTARTLYSHWSALPEPHRGHMARLLLTLSVR